MATTPIRPDIEVVKRVVMDAGRKALGTWGRIETEYKPDQSLVTVVDRNTERYIAGELQKMCPGSGFIGEEYGRRGPQDGLVWACDPIDGTTNYVTGLAPWCVSVGLLESGIPLMGALYLPVSDELFWAERGQGAYRNNERIYATDRAYLREEDAISFTSTALKTLDVSQMKGRVRCFGSIAAEIAFAAEGSTCAAVGMHEGLVDTAGGICVAIEAGCAIRTLDGAPLDLQRVMHEMHTSSHYLVGPPHVLDYLSTVLRPIQAPSTPESGVSSSELRRPHN